MESLVDHCIASDNYVAYKYENKEDYFSDMKIGNFTPNYDNWCLFCGNKYAKKRCSKCKSVWFCNETCQKQAWSVHKKHCGRDLFCICAFCGSKKPDDSCDSCRTKFCTQCKPKIYSAHKEIDCAFYTNNFG